jgi:hypothetical protein
MVPKDENRTCAIYMLFYISIKIALTKVASVSAAILG